MPHPWEDARPVVTHGAVLFLGAIFSQRQANLRPQFLENLAELHPAADMRRASCIFCATRPYRKPCPRWSA